jgi:hypothetical protein
VCTSEGGGSRNTNTEFKASLGYIVRSCLKKKKINKRKERQKEERKEDRKRKKGRKGKESEGEERRGERKKGRKKIKRYKKSLTGLEVWLPVIEHLPSKHENLSSNPSMAQSP